MRLSLLIFLFVWAVSLKAQTNVYHPFPDSNAVWGVSEVWGDQTCQISDDYDLYISSDDTIIGVFNYSKLKKSGFYSVSCDPNSSYGYNSGVIGYIRQDTTQKKIYFLSLTEEILLYDFNLNIGDTLTFLHQLGEVIIVTQIDSILIENNFRKKFILNGMIDPYCPFSPNFLIEGIGSSTGLLNNITCFFEGGTMLNCFGQNNQTLYPLSSECGAYVLSNYEKEEKPILKIFPSPASSQITVEQSAVGSRQLTVEVYDALGRLVALSEVEGQQTTIPLNLSKGVYLLRVKEKEEVVFWEKLIIE